MKEMERFRITAKQLKGCDAKLKGLNWTLISSAMSASCLLSWRYYFSDVQQNIKWYLICEGIMLSDTWQDWVWARLYRKFTVCFPWTLCHRCFGILFYILFSVNFPDTHILFKILIHFDFFSFSIFLILFTFWHWRYSGTIDYRLCHFSFLWHVMALYKT